MRIILGALLLLWPAVLNGYPLVYVDTGNYLGQALKHYVGWNAPPFYSIFLLATDWRLTLWLSIFAQAAIAAHLVLLVLRQFGLSQWFLRACLLLSLATSLPWFVCFVTPYVFAGFVILSLWLLGFGEGIGVWERRYLILLAIGSVAVHFSHVALAFGIALVGGVLALLHDGYRAGLRAFGRMAIAPAVAVAMLSAVDLAAHGMLSPAPYGSVLLAARFLYDGTAKDYLRSACPTRHYRICPYIDRLPAERNDFLFNWPPMETALGGDEHWAPEAGAIVWGTVTTEPLAVVSTALRNTAALFGHLGLHDGLIAWPDTPGPAPLIRRFFPRTEWAMYRHSVQEAGKLPQRAAWFIPLQVTVAWTGMTALVLLVLVLPFRRQHRHWRGAVFCVIVLAALLGNALITAGLSEIQDHYEGRIAWLMAFAPAVVAGGLRHDAGARRVDMA